jgi:non-ribosomal peptide synthetase component F/thioesterase domain-containing protein
MWLADQKSPGNPAYNGSFRWLLEGPLNPCLLERTFDEIVRRHEALRATFTVKSGKPVQIIFPSLKLGIDVKDLRRLPKEQREAEMDRLSAEEARKSFDLEVPPLIRVGLLRMGDECYILTLTLHHLVSDGWSIGLIMEELQKIYSGFAAGLQVPLPELSIQYPDYVIWQQESSAREDIAKQLAYWQKKLVGYRRLEIPVDFPRPAERTTNSDIVSSLLPRELSDALKQFSNQQGSTMFITTLACCMTLLRRYTGENDIALGSPLAGRNRTDLENLIGLFVNHVVFRTDASGDPLFTEFAARVKETSWEAFANQDVPFESVLKTVQPGVDAQQNPFYVINFICQREYARASTFVFEFGGVHMSTMPSKSQGALYDLNFFMVEREVGWRLSLEYNTDLYSKATAQQMLEHFQELLEGIVTNPKRRLSEFPLSGGSMLPRRKTAPVAVADPVAVNQETLNNAEALQSNKDAAEIYAMPASVAQERFWLLSKLFPGNPAFHMPASVRLSGSLDVAALEQSFRILINRHETLRTTFDELNGELVQIIAPSAQFSLPVSNIDNALENAREKRLEELIREEARLPFDLVGGPVFRARLFRLSPDDHALIVTIHHILADGWSQNVFQRELWSSYDAITQNKRPDLPSLAIQYGDFTTWQREWLNSSEAKEHFDFWTKQLSAPLPVLDFSTDRPPSHRASSKADLETLLLPEDLTRSLKSRSQSENVTMFMLMVACFATLLARYTGQEDVIIGSPVANRRTETEPLIGPFSGPVALRLNLSLNRTLRETLERAREVTLDALSHADMPFEILIDKLKVRSVNGRNPLFQFYFFYQTAFLQPRQLQRLAVTPMPTFSIGTAFEMQLGVIERAEGVRLQLEYNADLFDSSSMRRVLEDYRKILVVMAENPEKAINQLPVSAQTRTQISLPAKAALSAEVEFPQDETEKQLAKIWAEVLGVRTVGLKQDYFDLGGTSILAARLLKCIHERLGKELSLASLLDAFTIERQARLIRGDDGEGISREAATGEGISSEIPLFYLGGDPTFRPLSLRLSALHEFHSLGMQESAVQSLKDPHSLKCIAAYFVKVIRGRHPHGPYMLGGWCSHGLLALEVARQLRAQGERVALVVMMETANPVERMAYPKWKRFISSLQLKFNLAQFEYAYLREMKRAQALNYVMGRIKRKLTRAARSLENILSLRSSAVTKTALEVLYHAADNYQPEQYLGPVLLIRSTDRSFGFAQDLRLGWNDMFGDQLEICEVKGGHYSMYMKSNVEGLAREIDARLKKAEERSRKQ